MITMNRDSVLTDFKWVIKILDSSESKDHLETVLKCFNLWENKHVDKTLSSTDKKVITDLRGKFWSKFKNKNTKFGTTNI